MLRIDFWNIAFIIINLLVLYFFMKHFLIGPVTKIVDERRQMVEKDLEEAAAAREDAGRMKAQYEAAAASADQEARAIVQEARERAQAEYDKILVQARADAKKKQKDAERTIALEQEKAMEELKRSVAGLAMTAAARLLSEKTQSGGTGSAGGPNGFDGPDGFCGFDGPGEDQKRYQEFLAKTAESGEGHD